VLEKNPHEIGVGGTHLFIERRLDEARPDRVDPHAVFAELRRKRTRESEHPMLRGGVSGRVRRSYMHKRLDRGDIDDPALGGAELCQKRMSHIEHTIEVDREDVLPVRDHRLRFCGEGIAAVDPGIVNENGNLTNFQLDLRSNIATTIPLSDVERKTVRFTARATDRLDRLGR
jgi:hypothetical protein